MAFTPYTAAAIQVAPVPGPLTAASVKANTDKCVDYVERCVAATGASLVVLPESCTTGFTTGLTTPELAALVSEIGGPTTAPLQEAAARLGVHLCFGTYERRDADTVFNTAVLAGPDGEVLGVYRKSQPFPGEDAARGGWVTAGTEVCVADTALGRIGMAICFDGDYPELWRIMAVQGAQVICRPSALLRSADLWELTNRARAYDNHTWVIGANATGADPAGVLYFGNSMIVSPIAEVTARAASHESWVSARIDREGAAGPLTPGSSVAQGFDHVADRNLDLIRRYSGDLLGERKAD
jgi:predicted amidohydrolase